MLRLKDCIKPISILGLSYNQPRICADAVWSINATTFLNSAAIGSSPDLLFVDGLNTVYVLGRARNMIFVWPQGNPGITRNISGTFNRSLSMFVSINGDIYIDNGFTRGRVEKWSFSTSAIIPVLNVNGSCAGLFIDRTDTLFCSLVNSHQVVKSLSGSNPNSSIIAAGVGIAGSTSTMLDSPQGIYIDANLNLFVADCGNDRVQRFPSMLTTGVTMAGNGSSGTMTLDCPTSITLDLDGYLFIVDSSNHRIIGSGPYGFRCVAGCSGSGSAQSQLWFPQSIAFDSYGNMLVNDRNNSRIQRFQLLQTPCRKSFLFD
jgi:DNA-binding beta-propeller fold protein YncE